MNYQSKPEELQQISMDDASIFILKEFGERVFGDLEYYAFPYQFGTTGGPFKKPGGVYGQAFTTWTIEVWSYGFCSIVFCKGKIIKLIKNVGCQFNPSDFRL